MRKQTSFSKVDKVDQMRRLYLSLKNEKRNYIETHFLRKSKISSLKTVQYIISLFPNCFSLQEKQKRKKGKSSERFSVTQTNFDNYTSLDVELMKENLTSLLEIDKIK